MRTYFLTSPSLDFSKAMEMLQNVVGQETEYEKLQETK